MLTTPVRDFPKAVAPTFQEEGVALRQLSCSAVTLNPKGLLISFLLDGSDLYSPDCPHFSQWLCVQMELYFACAEG